MKSNKFTNNLHIVVTWIFEVGDRVREIDYKIAMLKEDVRFYKILFTIAFVNYILMLILVFILIGILKTPL